MNPPNVDQQLANIRDNLPRLWWALYEGCKDTGFTDEQALRIVIAFIQKPPEVS